MHGNFDAGALERAAPKRILSFSSPVLPGIIFGLDSVVILSVAIICFLALVEPAAVDVSYYVSAACFVWIAAVLLMNFAGLYRLDPIMRPGPVVDKIVVAFGTTFLFLFAAAFSLKISATFSRLWVAALAIGTCAGTLACRFLAARIVGSLADMRVFTRNVVVVGDGEQAQRLVAHLQGKARSRFITVLGIFSEANDGSGRSIGPYPLLGCVADVPSYIRANPVDDVIISLPWVADDKIVRLTTMLRELPVNVYLSADLVGYRLQFHAVPDHFGDTPLVGLIGRPLEGWGAIEKAVLDYSAGLVLTLMALPLFGLIALAIKLDSKGPVFFRQKRYGFVNRVFWIWKFRTMQDAAPSATTRQATRDDARITRVGRFLRRTSLDELPQLFNVLDGSMSLVGPRPHAVDHNEEYAKLIRGYFARHRVKPGITGWAQVHGFRGETSTVDKMEARVKHDIYYVENWSLLLDLRILVATVIAVLGGRNAY